MKQAKKIFYCTLTNTFYRECQPIAPPSPFSCVCLVLPSKYLLIAHIPTEIAIKNQDDLLYQAAFEELGLSLESEYSFKNMQVNQQSIAYLYPKSISYPSFSSLKEKVTCIYLAIPEIMLFIPFFKQIPIHTTNLFLLLDRELIFSVFVGGEIYFLQEIQAKIPEREEEYGEMLFKIQEIFSTLNFLNIQIDSVYVFSPQLNQTNLCSFFQEQYGLSVQDIYASPFAENLLTQNHSFCIRDLSYLVHNHYGVLELECQKKSYRHIKILGLLFIFVLLVTLLPQIWHISKNVMQLWEIEQHLEEEILAQEDYNIEHNEILLQKIREGEFDLSRLSAEDIYQIYSILFYQEWRENTKHLSVYLDEILYFAIECNLFIQRLSFSHKNHSQVILLNLFSQDNAQIVNFIEKIQRTNHYKHAFIHHTTLENQRYSSLVEILL
ncbi:hypothetical protein CCZ01_08290 [Helicobacter monodelphidis]|uniref:hypothetical protein n=1 Tax=Helicobacter sp. 15-1451 TaxID=2004995 RepID=UPI000DCC256F|nr:hypothetical protein [Helicobacter sp. 15-1451]RAX56847.1 hypothetical protein CCZ01_08290 [Helicobacter sp. 15-1451]